MRSSTLRTSCVFILYLHILYSGLAVYICKYGILQNMCLPLVTIGHETVMGKCTFFGTDYDRGM